MRMKTRFIRAQGATDYLVVLSVVLIIGLVSVSLLSYSPSTSKDTARLASNIYWQSTARPVQVKEVAQTGQDTYALAVENVEPAAVRITGVQLGGRPAEIAEGNCDSPLASEIYLDPGERKTIAVCDGLGVEGKAGQVVATRLKFDYLSEYGTERETEGKDVKILLLQDTSNETEPGNGSGGGACEGGLFLPTESGEYFYVVNAYDDAGVTLFSMDTPNPHQITTLVEHPASYPPVSMGQVSACQQMSFSWMMGWWGWWGPYYADSENCDFDTVGPNHWHALCRWTSNVPVPWDDYDWDWEVYRG